MYNRILFPTDGSDGARAVFDHVLDVAERHGATLHILNVADTTHYSVTRIGGDVIDTLKREGKDIVQDAQASAERRQIPTVTDVSQGGVPKTITGYADEYDIDLIILPTQGRTGLERTLLGSVTEKVIRQASVPVRVLCPDDKPFRYPHQNVLVPTDGSDCATAALEHAVDIVNATGATLHVLSVVDMASLGVDVRIELQLDALEEQAERVVHEATELARNAGVGSIVEATAAGSSIHRSIQSYVDENEIDLVVMGTHGRTGLERYLLGSVTEKTVRTASIPVLTVPDPDSNERNIPS